MTETQQSVDRLAGAMREVMESARAVVDITSLDPPRGPAGKKGVFYEAIVDGIKERARRGGRRVLSHPAIGALER